MLFKGSHSSSSEGSSGYGEPDEEGITDWLEENPLQNSNANSSNPMTMTTSTNSQISPSAGLLLFISLYIMQQ